MRLGQKSVLTRECCSCHATQMGNAKIIKRSDPIILTLSFTVYRRTPLGRQLGAASKVVYLCEACLGSILFSDDSAAEKGLRLGEAVARAAEGRYNAMLGAK